MLVLLQSNAIFVYMSYGIKFTAGKLNPFYLDRKHPIIITGKAPIFLAARLFRSAASA